MLEGFSELRTIRFRRCCHGSEPLIIICPHYHSTLPSLSRRHRHDQCSIIHNFVRAPTAAAPRPRTADAKLCWDQPCLQQTPSPNILLLNHLPSSSKISLRYGRHPTCMSHIRKNYLLEKDICNKTLPYLYTIHSQTSSIIYGLIY